LIVREFIAGKGGPGRDFVAERIVPLIDIVAAWAEGQTPPGEQPPVCRRSALVTIASECLLRAAMGELAVSLWGDGDPWERVRPLVVSS
jgi:hypothetical protein